jgi:hypothetical protein
MRNFFLFKLFVLFIFASSCKNDLDINSDPKETAVVYGIIDPNAKFQYLRINKTYLVKANAIEAAQNAGLMNFGTDIKVTLKRLETVNSKLVEKEAYAFVLDSSYVKDPGLFYKEPNVIFKAATTSPKLIANDKSEFVLEIENLKTGYKAFAKTLPVLQSAISLPLSFYFFKSNPAVYTLNLFGANTKQYTNVSIEFTTGKNTKIIFPYVRFFYHELFANVKSSALFIDFPMQYIRSNNSEGDEKIDLNLNSEELYRYIGEKIKVKSGVKRFVDSVSFVVETGNSDFDTFYTVSKTSSNTTLEKPIFTNITNGLGIFASKYTNFTTHKNYYKYPTDLREFYIDNSTSSVSAGGLNYPSLYELATGKYTKNLGFAYFTSTGSNPLDTLYVP